MVKIVKNPGNGRLNNSNDPVLSVLILVFQIVPLIFSFQLQHCIHNKIVHSHLVSKFTVVFWSICNCPQVKVYYMPTKAISVWKYCRVSFCDGLFHDDSLLRSLSSRTKHSRLLVYHCRNSSVLSILIALLALFRCACLSCFSVLVQFF